MATFVLQAAGSAIGSIFGPVGSVIGQALGGALGYGIDQSLFGNSQNQQIQGPRLDHLQVQSSTEGNPIPKIYGSIRISGQIIWATNFKEIVSDEEISEGGKWSDPQSITHYKYYINFAVGLCEGEINGIDRIWADGKLLDKSKYNIRIYTGSRIQEADPLIEAKQGKENTPAYRGLAYAVFENMPLAEFGNRIPQLSFEVYRNIDTFNDDIKAVCIIPGSTEFGYNPTPVYKEISQGYSISENSHSSSLTDWSASIETLSSSCRQLKKASLVVSWFGDDLRAGKCRILPKVEVKNKITFPISWQVSGLTRKTAETVSLVDGIPAFGSTPSDNSVIQAIQDLKKRDIEVLFYPFILMDIPLQNNLISPTGKGFQPPFPWRGKITCSSNDDLQLQKEIKQFTGSCKSSDFLNKNGEVVYNGPDEFSYRRFILHNAKLCEIAGGVSSFLIGSELKGMTKLYNSKYQFLFVNELIKIAHEVSNILRPETKISYAADWSEYFGINESKAPYNRFFNLDPLWADNKIDFIGIDNYMPLSDWRDEDQHLDKQKYNSIYSLDYLKSNIAGGEGFDWYYKNNSHRNQQIRTPIVDVWHQEHWIYRYKDLVSWWSKEHFPRINKKKLTEPTKWIPKSKPIWFTEFGIPAIEKGTNEPNVFFDPKSSESKIPYFSNAERDDLIQRQGLSAVLKWYDDKDKKFKETNNPLSDKYNGRMVDTDSCFLWCWDARPYPFFPALESVWRDSLNWFRGHWINGRTSLTPTGELIKAILDDFNFHDVEIENINSYHNGYIVDRPMSARQAIEPVLQTAFACACQIGNKIIFKSMDQPSKTTIKDTNLVIRKNSPLITVRNKHLNDIASEVNVSFIDALSDYKPAIASSKKSALPPTHSININIPLATDYTRAKKIAETILFDLWANTQEMKFAIAQSEKRLKIGDIIWLIENKRKKYRLIILEIADGKDRLVTARSIEKIIISPSDKEFRTPKISSVSKPSKPIALLLDLPQLWPQQTSNIYFACFTKPWTGGVNLYHISDNNPKLIAQAERPSTIGKIVNTNFSNKLTLGIWDNETEITVKILDKHLSSASPSEVLNGANICAIRTNNNQWELIQFLNALLIDKNTYLLTNLIRGQGGTNDNASTGIKNNGEFVLLNNAVNQIQITDNIIGSEQHFKAIPNINGVDTTLQYYFKETIIGRSKIPISPAYLQVNEVANKGKLFSWIRRGKVWQNANSWKGIDIAIDEQIELYQIKIYRQERNNKNIIRQEQTSKNLFMYTNKMQSADNIKDELFFEVSQISQENGSGIPSKIKFLIN